MNLMGSTHRVALIALAMALLGFLGTDVGSCRQIKAEARRRSGA
jgi:hypothetical protein